MPATLHVSARSVSGGDAFLCRDGGEISDKQPVPLGPLVRQDPSRSLPAISHTTAAETEFAVVARRSTRLGLSNTGPENMEYKRPQYSPKIKPRLIIHGGAGNIKPTNLTPERYEAVRRSLLGMVRRSENSFPA